LKTRAVAVSSALLLAACGGSSDAPTSPAPAAPTPAKAPEPAKAPPADPMKDVAAWKALPDADRAAKAADVVAKTNAGDASAVETTRAFLADRGEDAALASLAKAALAKGSTAAWTHQAAGDADVGPEVDACLKSCETAEDESDPKFVELKELRAKHAGTWWADATAAKDVRDKCAALKAQDKLLASPYGRGIAHWIRWQHAIPVMQDAPTIYGARGPYLVFVSLNSLEGDKQQEYDDKGRPKWKTRELKDVPPEELAKAQKVLDKNLALMEDFYEGWMTDLGPIFGFTRYGPENADETTLLKMNVFLNQAEYRRYNTNSNNEFMNEFARAYYTPREPRFITTYDGGATESPFETEQTQCHEATHQLVHLYTWDLTRKALNRDVRWEDCKVRPMWSEEGFAEFFSSFSKKDGKRTWMQPLVHRLLEIYLFKDILEAKKWKPFDIKELLTVGHAGQLTMIGEEKVGAAASKEEKEIAKDVIANLFYGKAWSLYAFLWNAESDGKPKYRDRFIEYLKFEFHLRYQYDSYDKKDKSIGVSAKDFRRILGLSDEAALAAFDAEWNAWETAQIAKYKNPAWDAARKGARKATGVDK
jgi:hypothetical protein